MNRARPNGGVRRCGALGLALVSTACADDAAAPPALEGTDRSASIAFIDDGLWVTSPDDDRVVRIDPDSGTALDHTTITGGPWHLDANDDASLYVTTRWGEDALVRIDGAEVQPIPIPCGGAYGVVAWGTNGATEVVVACPFDRRVVYVAEGGAVAVSAVTGTPTGVARDGESVYVALSDGLAIFDVNALRDGDAAYANVPLPNVGERGVSQLLAVDRGPDGPFAAWQSVDHDDRTRPPERGGYGDVHDGDPRIAPQLLGVGSAEYARFDGGSRVFSGPVDVAWAPATATAWVVNTYTRNVVVFDVGSSGARTVRAHFRVGEGARGIAVHADGRRAFVDVGFDHAVATLLLPDEPRELPVDAPTVRRVVGESRFDAAAERGRRIFHDALDTHLTPSGVVTCATCHPHGESDGLAWFFHTPGIAPKVRTTPAARVRPADAPYHWDAEFDDLEQLVDTTLRELLGGDGLLVDRAAVAAYLNQLPAPPPDPTVDGVTAARGANVFAAMGCGGCHTAGGSDGQRHRVLPEPADVGPLDAVDTPTLTAVRTRTRLGHDGRFDTLEALLAAHRVSTDPTAETITETITADDLLALRAYLRTL